jgi:hypothetical protein
MVGIALDRVYVRHLDHGKQHQQDKTQHSGCPESLWLPAAFPAEMRLKSCQPTTPALRIHMIGCIRAGRGYRFSQVFG